MNRNGNETESFAGNFVAPDDYGLFFEVPKGESAMIRLLFAILVSAMVSSQATAQNKISQALLGLNEDERNETFTHLLRDNNVKCDRVIRTLFNGGTLELDVWEALCRDRNSYSLSMPPEPNADIELVSCRELLATSKMLLERAGSKTKAMGCRIKRLEHQFRNRRKPLPVFLEPVGAHCRLSFRL